MVARSVTAAFVMRKPHLPIWLQASCWTHRRDYQEFRAGLGMMGAKEPAHAATQRTPYS
jgi:hypothetical protein